MATAIMTCRVCGKEYEACHSLRRGDTTFRWQEVACSPECGAEYLRRVLIARGELVDDAPSTEHKEEAKKTRRKKSVIADDNGKE